MNAYGIILNDIGMEPLIDELQQQAKSADSFSNKYGMIKLYNALASPMFVHGR